jgi:hypothetical protein
MRAPSPRGHEGERDGERRELIPWGRAHGRRSPCTMRARPGGGRFPGATRLSTRRQRPDSRGIPDSLTRGSTHGIPRPRAGCTVATKEPLRNPRQRCLPEQGASRENPRPLRPSHRREEPRGSGANTLFHSLTGAARDPYPLVNGFSAGARPCSRTALSLSPGRPPLTGSSAVSPRTRSSPRVRVGAVLARLHPLRFKGNSTPLSPSMAPHLEHAHAFRVAPSARAILPRPRSVRARVRSGEPAR